MATLPPKDRKIPVAVLGATGSVGQRFVALLADHPWFEIAALTASERSTGRPYAEAAHWMQATPLPPGVAARELLPTAPEAVGSCPLVFSALDAAVAGAAEEAFAAAGCLVVSNARSHRMDADVPLVVPEVNPDHLDLVPAQRAARGSAGAILTNPNCSTIGLVMVLKPLADAFGVERVHVVTLQAVSGAGLPGVPGMQVIDNVIPWIGGEEEKLERETRKILGRLEGASIAEDPVEVSAQCTRVPVVDGHTLAVSVTLGRRVAAEEVRAAWEGFTGEPQERRLPSAPDRPVRYLEAPDAPQPRLHRDLGRGMTAAVGRLRPCPLFDYKFVTLSHNTLRGAAGGSILLGELAVARGLVAASSS